MLTVTALTQSHAGQPSAPEPVEIRSAACKHCRRTNREVVSDRPQSEVGRSLSRERTWISYHTAMQACPLATPGRNNPRMIRRSSLCLTAMAALLVPLSSAEDEPPPTLACNFDSGPADGVVRGRIGYVLGVSGNAARFDGFTTTVILKPERPPSLERGFGVAAWIAPQEYSWNRTAIVSQGADRESGFFFSMDDAGRIGVSAASGKSWITATSTLRVPLLRWTHVAASFDPVSGLRVYIDGREAAAAASTGPFVPSTDDIRVGTSRILTGVTGTEREPSRQALAQTRMVFDGLIDEVRLYDRPLTPGSAAVLAAALRPKQPQPLSYRVLPSGPKGVRRFGAYYETLHYADGWDSLWRSSGPDIVVAFDFAPVRLVSWRGISYNPCWVMENGTWFSNEFMERSLPAGCAESMSDKQARFSSAKILESNDARTIIYWRYSPVDIHYTIPFPDPETGWGDWAEEYYTVYPDGVAVRKFIGYTSVPRGRSFFEWSQSLPVMQPGQRPEDVMNDAPMLSLANMDGQSQDYRWPPRQEDRPLPDANIQVVNFRSEYKPFLILTDRQPRITLPPYRQRDPAQEVRGTSMSLESNFWWWNHWPVAMLPSDGRVAPAADRPSHSWAATQDSTPWATTEKSETQLMLCGVTRAPASGLVPLARSWMRAPELKLADSSYLSRGYDAGQRAYVLQAVKPGSDLPLRFTLSATAQRPLVNPAFIVEGWAEADTQLRLNGKAIARGPDFRVGVHRGLDRANLAIWLRTTSTRPVTITIERKTQARKPVSN